MAGRCLVVIFVGAAIEEKALGIVLVTMLGNGGIGNPLGDDGLTAIALAAVPFIIFAVLIETLTAVGFANLLLFGLV